MALEDTLQQMRDEMSKYFGDVADMMGEVSDRITHLGNHVTNTNNPHRVEKDEVGLGEVQNFPVATREQAIDGDTNFSYMTPLRTREAIDVMFDAMIDAFEDASNDINQ